jgi:hypothetical protein
MSMKNSSDTIGDRTRYLPSQLTAPPRAPINEILKDEMTFTDILYIVHEYCFRGGIDLQNGDKCSAFLP